MEANGSTVQPEANTVPVANGHVPNWRNELPPGARQRIANKITDTLKKHSPIFLPEALSELHRLAVRFEERVYTEATSQSDYLRRIALKMLSFEARNEHNGPNQYPLHQVQQVEEHVLSEEDEEKSEVLP